MVNVIEPRILFIRQFAAMCRDTFRQNPPMKKVAGLSLLFSILLVSPAQAQTITILENTVKPIELAQQSASLRIVAIANGSAEIVAALGLHSSIVGRDIASTTTELKSIPIVTSGHQVIAEKILSLRPTLVLVDENTGPKSALDTLRKSKVRIVKIPSAWKLDDISRKISAIGKATTRVNEAHTLNKKLESTIAGAKSSIGWKPRIAFLYLRGPSSIYLLGGPGSGADSLISSLGGLDVGAQTLKNPFNPMTAEALVSTNPDVLLVMNKGLQSVGGEKGLLRLPGVMQTQAGKNGNILAVDDSLLLSFGPRTPALLKAMASALRELK